MRFSTDDVHLMFFIIFLETQWFERTYVSKYHYTHSSVKRVGSAGEALGKGEGRGNVGRGGTWEGEALGKGGGGTWEGEALEKGEALGKGSTRIFNRYIRILSRDGGIGLVEGNVPPFPNNVRH